MAQNPHCCRWGGRRRDPMAWLRRLAAVPMSEDADTYQKFRT